MSQISADQRHAHGLLFIAGMLFGATACAVGLEGCNYLSLGLLGLTIAAVLASWAYQQ